ncbi:ferritin light chain 2-like [Phyllostomus hastatus]|uniref:ferritin light chain 2-like n=1 Tax=Phyllostomus hastatus TaxID=9423 RepID=UPI001E681537|nr:ferritin light chain 2-like [Phyllostomus hastatus]
MCGAPHTYLSLGFSFHQEAVALKGVGHFFPKLAEKWEGTECLLKMQNQCSGHILFQGKLKSPKMSGVKLRRRTWTRSWALLCRPSSLRLPVSHFLDEEVKLIKKVGNWLTNLRRPWPPGWAGQVSLPKGSPSSTTRKEPLESRGL